MELRGDLALGAYGLPNFAAHFRGGAGLRMDVGHAGRVVRVGLHRTNHAA
jgi:hypothetical protein